MKKQLLIGSVFGSLLLVGNAMAQCPSNLTTEQKYDCIVMEGAGDFYEVPAEAKTVVKPEQAKQETGKNDKLAAVNQ